MDPFADRHAAVFVQRYAWLRGWALRLSNGDHLEADDLLHSAFLQFVGRRRELSEIENLEAYLYGLLRRMRLARSRKDVRRREDPLPEGDCTAAVPRVAAPDIRDRLQTNDELSAVCDYACHRKQTSKAGSVLLLRFFHGYYPKEIARILRCSLRLANDWLRIARHEARRYIDQPPAALREVHSEAPAPIAGAVHDAETLDDVLAELRTRIRHARTGVCLTDVDLYRLYDDPAGETVPSSILGHIVSCPVCLERVTRRLNLSPYDERDPFAMLGPDGGWRTADADEVPPSKTTIYRRGAYVATIACGVALWMSLPWRSTHVFANELLRSARIAERALVAAPGAVTHRVVIVEERSMPERTVRRRQRVEQWQDAGRKTAVRRLYDDRDRLRAGEWTQPDQSRTLYQSSGAGPSALPPRPLTTLPDADLIWTWEPSASHFAAIVDALAPVSVDDRGDVYVVRYLEPPSDRSGVIAEASVTIRKDGMRAVTQTVVVRVENDMREYAFMETTLEHVPEASVPTHTFEPERELLPLPPAIDPPVVTPSAGRVDRTPSVIAAGDVVNRLEFDALVDAHRTEATDSAPGSLDGELDELGRLATTWPPERLATLDLDRMAAWIDLVRDHARRFTRFSVAMRHSLEIPANGLDASPESIDLPIVPVRSATDVHAGMTLLVAQGLKRDARSLRLAEEQAAWFDEPIVIALPSAPSFGIVADSRHM